MNINKRFLFLAAFSGAIVTLDQLTKLYIHTNFYLGESITLIDNYFNFTYVRNTGAAFGMFRESSEVFRSVFFLSLPPLVMVIILYILWGVEDKDRLQTLALTCIFGGAIGNYVDRIRFGYVIDFLDLHFRHFYTWPAFNVADSFIVVGSLILPFILYKQYKQEKAALKSSEIKN